MSSKRRNERFSKQLMYDKLMLFYGVFDFHQDRQLVNDYMTF